MSERQDEIRKQLEQEGTTPTEVAKNLGDDGLSSHGDQNPDTPGDDYESDQGEKPKGRSNLGDSPDSGNDYSDDMTMKDKGPTSLIDQELQDEIDSLLDEEETNEAKALPSLRDFDVEEGDYSKKDKEDDEDSEDYEESATVLVGDELYEMSGEGVSVGEGSLTWETIAHLFKEGRQRGFC